RQFKAARSSLDHRAAYRAPYAPEAVHQPTTGSSSAGAAIESAHPVPSIGTRSETMWPRLPEDSASRDTESHNSARISCGRDVQENPNMKSGRAIEEFAIQTSIKLEDTDARLQPMEMEMEMEMEIRSVNSA
ncbi:hypothetical protein BG011_002153, partial [Mortierella polycephala]